MIIVEFLNRRVLINESSFNSIDFDQEAETLTLESATDKKITTYQNVKGVHTKRSGDTNYFASNPHQNLLDEIIRTRTICSEAYHKAEKLHVLVCDTITQARWAETKEQLDELLKKLADDRYEIKKTTPPFEEQQKEIRKNENEYIKQMRLDIKAGIEATLRPQIEAELRSKLEADPSTSSGTAAVVEPVETQGTAVDKPTDPRLGRAAKHASFNPIDYIINHMRRNRRPNIE